MKIGGMADAHGMQEKSKVTSVKEPFSSQSIFNSKIHLDPGALIKNLAAITKNQTAKHPLIPIAKRYFAFSVGCWVN